MRRHGQVQMADAPVGELGADEPREGAVLLRQLRADADDVPTQEARRVHEVAGVTEQVVAPPVGLRVALRPHRSLARDGQRLDRVGHLIAIGRVAVPRPHREHFADVLGDEIPRVRDIRVEAAHRADLKHQSGGADRGGERFAFLDVDAHRLLDEHVLSGVERLQRHRHVELVGDRDDHGVDVRVGEHPLVIRVGDPRPMGGRDGLKKVLGRVAERVELGVAGLAAGFEMRGLGDRAGAENTHSQPSFVCVSHRAPRVGSGGQGGGRAQEQRGVLLRAATTGSLASCP